MRTRNILCSVALLIICLSACKLDNINPNTTTGGSIQPPTQTGVTGKTDTSKTLITNTSLVGTYNIVSDTVSNTTSFKYMGTPSDHFIFTKYGNLFIKNGFQNQVDTATYTISAKNKVQWIYGFWSINGTYSRTAASPGSYDIRLTADSLILTQSTLSQGTGSFYEQIKLLKVH